MQLFKPYASWCSLQIVNLKWEMFQRRQSCFLKGATFMACRKDSEKLAHSLSSFSAANRLQSIREAVQSATCPGRCSGEGSCANGICTCHEGTHCQALLLFKRNQGFAVVDKMRGSHHRIYAFQSYAFSQCSKSEHFGSVIAFQPRHPRGRTSG